MTQLDDLIRENEELKSRLQICQNWMMRQVAESRLQIDRAKVRISGRHYFSSQFEIDLLQNTDQIFDQYFWNLLDRAPRFTRDRLYDAEIYWNTLQKYSHVDALSIILAYQKILDSYFEKFTDIFHSMKNKNFHTMENSGIEHDIFQVIDKQYSLSLGRWYQLLSLVRAKKVTHPIILFFLEQVETHFPENIAQLTADAVFLPFEQLIQMEVFSHKRHSMKISYKDAEFVRQICTGWFQKGKSSLFLTLFTI
jgi:hypothetical protein